MTFAAVGTSVAWDNTATGSITPAGIGHFVLVVMTNDASATSVVTALSSSPNNITWTTAGPALLGSTNAYTAQMFIGQVTGTTATTVTPTWSGTAGTIQTAFQEYSTTAGFAAVTLDVRGTFDHADSNVWPSLTPGHGAGEMYFGFGIDGGTAAGNNGTPAGYVYETDNNGNGLAYNVSCGTGAQTPTWTDSGMQFGIAVLLYEAGGGTAGTPPARWGPGRFPPLSGKFPGQPFDVAQGTPASPSGPVSVSDTDACVATDAGEKITLIPVASSDDACIATDASETIHVSDTDASTAADSGTQITLTGITEGSQGSDNGGAPNASLSGADFCVASDGSEEIHVSSSDAALDTDQASQISLGSADASSGADSGTQIALNVTDASAAADGTEQIHVTDSDASFATDAGEGIKLSDTDFSTALDGSESVNVVIAMAAPPLPRFRFAPLTGSFPGAPFELPPSGPIAPITVSDTDFCVATDAGEAIAATLSDTDGSTAADSGTQIALSSSDSTSGADSGTTIQLNVSDGSSATDASSLTGKPSDTDASQAADSGTVIDVVPVLADDDSGTAADNAEEIHVSDSDASSAADAASQLALSDTDFSAAADGSEFTYGTFVIGTPPLPPARFAPLTGSFPGAPFALPPSGPWPPSGPAVVTDTETVTCCDSGFTFITSPADSCQALDAGETITQFVVSSDAGMATDSAGPAAGTYLINDSDACMAQEVPAAFFTGTLFTSDTDFCIAQETFAKGQTSFSDTDACTSLDTEHEQVEVYSYQPLFRWTGGGFDLVWQVQESAGTAVITVWRGPVPDRNVYLLAQTLVSSYEVRHVHDDEACETCDEGPAPELAVSVRHRQALRVSVTTLIA